MGEAPRSAEAAAGQRLRSPPPPAEAPRCPQAPSTARVGPFPPSTRDFQQRRRGGEGGREGAHAAPRSRVTHTLPTHTHPPLPRGGQGCVAQPPCRAGRRGKGSLKAAHHLGAGSGGGPGQGGGGGRPGGRGGADRGGDLLSALNVCQRSGRGGCKEIKQKASGGAGGRLDSHRDGKQLPAAPAAPTQLEPGPGGWAGGRVEGPEATAAAAAVPGARPAEGQRGKRRRRRPPASSLSQQPSPDRFHPPPPPPHPASLRPPPPLPPLARLLQPSSDLGIKWEEEGKEGGGGGGCPSLPFVYPRRGEVSRWKETPPGEEGGGAGRRPEGVVGGVVSGGEPPAAWPFGGARRGGWRRRAGAGRRGPGRR